MPTMVADRSAVRRVEAERYLRYVLICFAATVITVRWLLSVTGYPRLAGGELHIAHVLWGGLLLFAAAVTPLIVANRWASEAGAILAGIGVGLFIDKSASTSRKPTITFLRRLRRSSIRFSYSFSSSTCESDAKRCSRRAMISMRQSMRSAG